MSGTTAGLNLPLAGPQHLSQLPAMPIDLQIPAHTLGRVVKEGWVYKRGHFPLSHMS